VSRVFRTFVESQVWWCSAPPRRSRKFLHGHSCCFAHFCLAVYVQIAARGPFGAGHVAQSCRRQHQCRLAFGKCTHSLRSSPHFPQRLVHRVVRPQTLSMFPRKRILVQRLFDSGHHQRSRIRQFHLLKFRSDLFRILTRRRAIILPALLLFATKTALLYYSFEPTTEC